MKTNSLQGISVADQALLVVFAGAVYGAVAGGFAIARFRSGQPPTLMDGAWFLVATAGMWFCLGVGLGVNTPLRIVTGMLAGSVVGILVGLATGTHDGILAGAVVGGVIGENSTRTPWRDKTTVGLYDQDLDG